MTFFEGDFSGDDDENASEGRSARSSWTSNDGFAIASDFEVVPGCRCRTKASS